MSICQNTGFNVDPNGEYTGSNAFLPFQEEVVFDPLTTQRPCVGLCHYYRSLGVDNPYETRDQAKFTP